MASRPGWRRLAQGGDSLCGEGQRLFAIREHSRVLKFAERAVQVQLLAVVDDEHGLYTSGPKRVCYAATTSLR